MDKLDRVDWKELIRGRLRQLMQDHRDGPLSLPQLEKMTDGRLSKSRLGNYTQGTRLPDPAAATILAAALGTTAARVLCIDEHIPVMSEDEIKAVEDLRTLNAHERSEYLRHLSALATIRREDQWRSGIRPAEPPRPPPPKRH